MAVYLLVACPGLPGLPGSASALQHNLHRGAGEQTGKLGVRVPGWHQRRQAQVLPSW